LKVWEFEEEPCLERYGIKLKLHLTCNQRFSSKPRTKQHWSIILLTSQPKPEPKVHFKAKNLTTLIHNSIYSNFIQEKEKKFVAVDLNRSSFPAPIHFS
jgi:hypothetical protein